MKARFLVLAGAALLLVSGCTNANSETEPVSTNAVVPPAPAEPSVVASTNTAPDAAKPLAEDEGVPAGEPVNIVATPPPSIKLSPAAGEVTKLVQAGVDANVILAYVTNSPNTFRLEADEIVYLKDLGLAPEVVTAMIQRDQKIKEASLTGATVTSPSTSTSVWTAGVVAPSNSVWAANEPAPAAQPSTATTVPPPPTEEVPAPETVNYFYDSLAPYGTWVDVDGYGRCWRPTVVVTTPGWRPYSHCGRWEWTDSGWYWYSDYSWGWAPFHYGRWFSHPRWGWCWVPGSEWGPSWVSWRYSDAYYGWSPLPPAACYSPSIGFTYYGRSCGSSFSFGLTWDCFTFVSYNNFRHHRYDRDCVPHHQAGVVYNNTTVVNNIIKGNNNTIINQGIAPTRITAAGGGPIKQVTIRDGRGPRGGQAIRHEEIAHDGNIKVIRPTVPTGHGHTAANAGNGPARGGAGGLTSGNGTVVAPTTTPSSTTLVPPRGGGSGPRRNVPTIGGSSAPAPASPTSPTTGQATTPASPTPPVASTPPVKGTGGTRPPAHGTPSVWSNPNTAATPNTPQQGTPGSLTIRTPRTPRGTKENSLTPGNGFAQPTVTPSPTAPSAPSAPTQPSMPSTPNAPTVASTPGPTRTPRSQATPWLNNTPSSAPVKSPQLAEQSGPTRSWPTRDNNTSPVKTWGSGNNNSTPNAPSYVAPPVRSSPTYQAPAQAPTRSFSAPAAPQQSQPYNPPVRSAPERYTPPSQPSYSPPARESAPSRSVSSPPPSPAPRSEPRSSSSGSSSRGSDSSSKSSSKDDRSSRGR